MTLFDTFRITTESIEIIRGGLDDTKSRSLPAAYRGSGHGLGSEVQRFGVLDGARRARGKTVRTVLEHVMTRTHAHLVPVEPEAAQTAQHLRLQEPNLHAQNTRVSRVSIIMQSQLLVEGAAPDIFACKRRKNAKFCDP